MRVWGEHDCQDLGAGPVMILCPHCEERCDGRCRFKLGRRGFVSLMLGAAVASLLPAMEAPPVPLYVHGGVWHPGLIRVGDVVTINGMPTKFVVTSDKTAEVGWRLWP